MKGIRMGLPDWKFSVEGHFSGIFYFIQQPFYHGKTIREIENVKNLIERNIIQKKINLATLD